MKLGLPDSPVYCRPSKAATSEATSSPPLPDKLRPRKAVLGAWLLHLKRLRGGARRMCKGIVRTAASGRPHVGWSDRASFNCRASSVAKAVWTTSGLR
jgi:hypothetical protein